MTVYFLESSALAKLFVAEKGSDRLIDLVEQLTQPQKLVSTLGIIEVHSAIRRRERAGELSQPFAEEALGIARTEFGLMTELPINTSVVESAKQLIDRHGLRALDALQLAGCWVGRITSGITDTVFVASDRVLLAAAQAEGFQTLNPETI